MTIFRQKRGLLLLCSAVACLTCAATLYAGPGGADFTLSKSADPAALCPGETVTYDIVYCNTGEDINGAVDIVWIVDSSGSTNLYHEQMYLGSVAFFNRLNADGVDFQMGVVNMNRMGDDRGCQGEPTDGSFTFSSPVNSDGSGCAHDDQTCALLRSGAGEWVGPGQVLEFQTMFAYLGEYVPLDSGCSCVFGDFSEWDNEGVSGVECCTDDLHCYYEYGFRPMAEALEHYTFRPGAKKVFILVTDEPDYELMEDGKSASASAVADVDGILQGYVDLMNANDVAVISVVNMDFANPDWTIRTYAQRSWGYWGDGSGSVTVGGLPVTVEGISHRTGGSVYDIAAADLSAQMENIALDISDISAAVSGDLYDTIPAGITYVGSDRSNTISAGIIDWGLGAVPQLTCGTVSWWGVVDWGTPPGSIDNRSNTYVRDTMVISNNAAVDVLDCPADFTLAKSVLPAAVCPGDTVTYMIEYCNTGTDEIISTTCVVDVVFMVDSTGSMGDELQSIADNAPILFQGLGNAGLDFQIGVTDYTYTAAPPMSVPRGVSGGLGVWEPAKAGGGAGYWTTNQAEFQEMIAMGAGSKADECGIMEMDEVYSNYTFRANSCKYFILVSDEQDVCLDFWGSGFCPGVADSSTCPEYVAARNFLLANGVIVHTITPHPDPACTGGNDNIINQAWMYWRGDGIAAETGGQALDIYCADWTATINDITTQIVNSADATLQVHDTVPTGLSYLGSDTPAAVAGGVISWDVGTVSAGECGTIEWYAEVDTVLVPPLSVDNLAHSYVEGSDGVSNSATLDVVSCETPT